MGEGGVHFLSSICVYLPTLAISKFKQSLIRPDVLG